MAAMRLILLTATTTIGKAQDPWIPPGCCPQLRNLTLLVEEDPEAALAVIKESPLYRERPPISPPVSKATENSGTPVVMLHGLTDSCYTSWTKSLTQGAGEKVGAYSVCIPTHDNLVHDFLDTIFIGLDDMVDIIAAKVRADPQLRDGFNLIGISQGGLVGRAYLERYNDPPVKNFLSIHGIVAGVAALPGCFTGGKPLGVLCGALDEVLGDLAYEPEFQKHICPAGDFRSPVRAGGEQYLNNSILARLNNEGAQDNATYTRNFGKVKSFALIKALQESVVYPNEAEWWGHFKDGSLWRELLPMKETPSYKQDLFGLKTADEAGKLFFETTAGDHCEFSEDEYYGWLETYFMAAEDQEAGVSIETHALV